PVDPARPATPSIKSRAALACRVIRAKSSEKKRAVLKWRRAVTCPDDDGIRRPLHDFCCVTHVSNETYVCRSMSVLDVPQLRIREVNAAPVHASRPYVLYWMIAARRARANFALQRAV